MIDRLPRRPEGRHRDQVRLHQAAGRALGVVEALLERHAIGRRQRVQDLVLVGLVEVLEDVDGVVGFEIAHTLDHRLGGEIVEDLLAHGVVDLGQRREVEVVAEQRDQLQPVFLVQRLQQRALVGLVQLGNKAAHRRPIVAVNRVGHRLDEGPRDLAVLIPEHQEGLGRLRGLVGVEHGTIRVLTGGGSGPCREAHGPWQRRNALVRSCRSHVHGSTIWPRHHATAELWRPQSVRSPITRRSALAGWPHFPFPPSPSRAAARWPLRVRPIRSARRELAVGTKGGLFVGLKSYPAALPLGDGEFVLTFDDGPMPGITERVLDALACENAKATFFMIGRNAKASSALARRVRAAGHTIACHSWSHPWTMRQRSFATNRDEVDRGFKAIADAIGEAPAPFFRYPGFADTAELNTWLAERDIGVFGCDFWASDWVVMTPGQELTLVTGRMEKAGRGMVLFHDTHAQTASMIPDFLRTLKRQGKRVVGIVPGSGATPRPCPPPLAGPRR